MSQPPESKVLQHLTTIVNSLLTAACIYFGSTLTTVSKTVVRLETQQSFISNQLKEYQQKIDTAYYTGLQNQKELERLQSEINKK